MLVRNLFEESHLIAGRALWPDGTPRNGSAIAVMKDEVRAPAHCEVLEALGIEENV